MSDSWERAWQYTRLVSPHDEVRKADRDAYGNPINDYPLAHALGPVVPLAPWKVRLTDRDLRYRLLCFDFDVAGGALDEIEAAQDDADALSRILGELSIVHLVCESSSKGGRHVWVALTEGASRDLARAVGVAAKALFPSLDHGMLANPVSGGARPPLSPHRNGSYSRPVRGQLDALTMPSTTVQDLEGLLAELYARRPAPELQLVDILPADTVAPGGRRELVGKARAWLNAPGGGENPSNNGFTCLLLMISAGWSFDEARAAAASLPGMETYRTRRNGDRGERRPRTSAEQQQRLERDWEKASTIATVRSYRPRPRTTTARPDRDISDLIPLVSIVEDLLDRFRVNPGRWGGRYGAPTRRTVLTALAYLTLSTGKAQVAASTRTLAELCNIDQSTAARALIRLAQDGLVVRVSSAETINSAVWSLHLPVRFSTSQEPDATQPLKSSIHPPPRTVKEVFAVREILMSQLENHLTSIQHDVFSYRGLGHLAGQVFGLLKIGVTFTVETLGRSFGIGATHAAAILSRLRKYKLLRKELSSWAAPRRDLRNRAAAALNVVGTLERRIERHKVDRHLWRWWQDAYERMSTPPQFRTKRRHVTERDLFGEHIRTGEWDWPMYPRMRDDPRGRADHRRARREVQAGIVSPTSRWQLPRAA